MLHMMAARIKAIRKSSELFCGSKCFATQKLGRWRSSKTPAASFPGPQGPNLANIAPKPQIEPSTNIPMIKDNQSMRFLFICVMPLRSRSAHSRRRGTWPAMIVFQFHKPVNCQPARLLPASGFVERSRCAGWTIYDVMERPEFQTPGDEKHTFQSHSITPKIH